MGGEFGFMMIGNPFNDITNPCLSYRGGIHGGIVKEYNRKTSTPLDKINVLEIFEAKNNISKDIIDNFYNSIAIGIYNLNFILAPEIILIGGAISKRNEILTILYEKLQNIGNRMEDIKGQDIKNFIKLERCFLENDAGQIGALYNFLIKHNHFLGGKK